MTISEPVEPELLLNFYYIFYPSVFDCFDVRLYEEVVRMPAVESKVIAIVGKLFKIDIRIAGPS